MKISYNWLKQYVDIEIPPQEVAKLLTGCGLEVESIEKFESIKGGLKGVVIGEVKTKVKHPDADKLSITTVDIGNNELLHIVCGAPNVEAGQKVLIATIGTTIYNEEESFIIKKSKIRGELSEGMICAEDELGLGKSHAGIMVLDNSAKIGLPASEYFKIEEDYTFEIGLTPNRADATSHIGVARDLVTIINTSNISRKTTLIKPSVNNFKKDNDKLPIKINVIDTNACPRYSGLTLTNVCVKESPDWLKNRLKSVGLRPINNIVDITNFVLLETGQPMHAFDAAQIKGNTVIVKKLPKGTKFTTLDETVRELSAEDLIICNEEEGMCIAGVFGGIKSGVTNKSTNIFLESAYFEPVHIRKTSKLHGLKTDASFRFERGANPDITIYALKRTALLIKEIAGGEISSDIIDVYPKAYEKFKVDILYTNVDRLIGKTIERNIIKEILKNLEIDIISENNEGLKLEIPPFKVDVQREVDVIEEILRIYGYNNIEIPLDIKSSLSYTKKPDKENIINTVSNYLTDNGFVEIMSNSLTKSEYSINNSFINPDNNVKILNPLSKDLDVMRQTLLFSGLEAIAYNQNRKSTDLKLYEFGKSYHLNSSINQENKQLAKYSEIQHFAMFLCGKKNPESWYQNNENIDFYYLKSFVHNILKRICNNYKHITIKQLEPSFITEGLAYYYNKTKLVEFGILNKITLKQFDLKQEVYYADFLWENLLKAAEGKILYEEITKFPEVRRDLALLVDKNILFSQIEEIAQQTEKKLLKQIGLFDIYEGDKIDSNKKSYAVSFVLQDYSKTLTDKEIEKIMARFIKAFKEKIGAIIR